MKYTVVIIGGGPGGLACGSRLASKGLDTLIIERKKTIGPKVCAGGITWSGLISRVPEELIEASFPQQHIRTKYQRITISSPTPIIATINRTSLGQFMAQQAIEHGADILTGTVLRSIDDNTLVIYDTTSHETKKIHFDYLVGADGSLSKVRKHLNIPTEDMGIGINYQLPFRREKMEWHLHTRYFNNGYGWIFPHADTLSVGAYVDQKSMSAKQLKENLITWADTQNLNLANTPCSAEFINCDYRGWDFGNIFLVGDAAGFASALTGEGIYPAIVSGEAVAEKILNPKSDIGQIERMIKRQKQFRKMVKLTGRNKLYSSALAELGLLLLRMKVLNFRHLEMAS